MTDPTADRPLVTFALFAYNQEQYIREAVEGAFSQTYEPLEIILSDDCSSDRTYEIMQEMAAAYEGPHEVRVRHNQYNFGLIDHVNEVSSEMLGTIMVLAAGDDISLPFRTERLMSIFEGNPSTVLAHSSAFTIDKAGRSLGEHRPPPSQSLENIMRSGSIYIGATGAIHRSLIDLFEPIRYQATYEDLVFGTRAALVGEIAFVDDKLVKYRSDTGIIFKSKNTHGRVVRRRQKIFHRLETMYQRRIDTQNSNHTAKQFLLDIIDKEISRALARLQFYDQPKSFALGFLGPKRIDYLKATSSETKYMLGLIG